MYGAARDANRQIRIFDEQDAIERAQFADEIFERPAVRARASGWWVVSATHAGHFARQYRPR